MTSYKGASKKEDTLENKIEGEKNNLFEIKTAQEWINQAKEKSIPKQLFSEFWHEGEVCILFADTNLGKSILAVQIADSISKGIPIPGFQMEAQKQDVLYLDFELSEKQFENRYSENFSNHYSFDNGLLRVEINPDADIPSHVSFEEFLFEALEEAIKKVNAKILIVDNITYLKTDTERAKDALPLMKHLKKLKNKYGLSILALAHTPKRDLTKPITVNDLQGSKMLINFCDSAFTIGQSCSDDSLRYIKQIKARHTKIIYGTDNVCVCQIEKTMNFVGFMYLSQGVEWRHLKMPTDSDRDNLKDKILERHKKRMSYRQIADELNISHMMVSRIINNL